MRLMNRSRDLASRSLEIFGRTEAVQLSLASGLKRGGVDPMNQGLRGNGTSEGMPLEAMHEQLRYWENECEIAQKAGNAERVDRCVRYIAQCEMVIAALESAGTPPVFRETPDTD